MNSEFVQIKQLSFAIAGKNILNCAEFNICRGALVALIGANGSGKTTLLKIICGLARPTFGIVKIGAGDARQSIGFAPDTPPLYMHDTVYSYLKFIGKLKRTPSVELETKINELIGMFDLGAVRKSQIYTLSKGMQQRVNLAQALINDPQLLVLDEPTNALDPEQCANLGQQLIRLKNVGKTIIVASHEYTEIVPLCDYMLKLSNGTLQKILTPLSTQEFKVTNDQIHHPA